MHDKSMPLQPSTIFPVFDSARFCSKTYIRIGNHLHVKSSGVAQGLAKFANSPPPGLRGGALGAAGID